MKITKFVHSCLLVETGSKNVLIDPGGYSWHSHLFSQAKINRLDYIVITHEHGDHYSLPFLKDLVKKYPHTQIITNSDLAEKLKKDGLKNEIGVGSEEGATVFESAHEPLPLDLPVPANIGVHIEDLLTHPGDALHFSHTRRVLALPMTAPWGSLKQSLERVVELKPRIVLPIHDWHWHKDARNEQYAMAAKLLLPHGIKFIALENAIPIEI